MAHAGHRIHLESRVLWLQRFLCFCLMHVPTHYICTCFSEEMYTYQGRANTKLSFQRSTFQRGENGEWKWIADGETTTKSSKDFLHLYFLKMWNKWDEDSDKDTLELIAQSKWLKSRDGREWLSGNDEPIFQRVGNTEVLYEFERISSSDASKVVLQPLRFHTTYNQYAAEGGLVRKNIRGHLYVLCFIDCGVHVSLNRHSRQHKVHEDVEGRDD